MKITVNLERDEIELLREALIEFMNYLDESEQYDRAGSADELIAKLNVILRR